VAQRKPIWWIFAQLGRRLGIQVLSPDLDIDTVTHEEVLASLVSPEKLALVKAAPSVYVEEGPVYGWILDRGPLLDGRWQFDHPEVLEELVRIEPPGPLALVPRRQVRHMNSVFYRPDEPSVIVNPADAASAEVCVGDRVRVSSPYGSVEGKILVTGDIARGSVSIPHGFNDLLVGNLTSDTSDVDRLNGMVTYSGVSLRIELVRRAGSGEA
jgi:formylmethanofuran dehydrogenase subunit D